MDYKAGAAQKEGCGVGKYDRACKSSKAEIVRVWVCTSFKNVQKERKIMRK
jgi:hypothetical protein